MKTIHKLQLPLNMGQSIVRHMPFNSKILSCGFQYDNLIVWYIVDTTVEQREQRYFHVIETGDELPDGIERVNFIGTVKTNRGADVGYYVVHVFEGQLV